MAFGQTVDPPRGLSYGAPQVDFSILGDLYNTYQQSQRNQQGNQLNDLAIAKQKSDAEQQARMRTMFANGLPMKDGQIDFAQVANAMAKAGNINSLEALYPAIDAQMGRQMTSPLLTGGPAPGAAQPPPFAPATAPPPGNLPPTSRSPQGDQAGSVMGLVATRLGDGGADTGRVATSIAAKLGVDPNAALTPGQQRRAQGLLDREAPSARPPAAPAAPVAPVGTVPLPQPDPRRVQGGDSFEQRFPGGAPPVTADPPVTPVAQPMPPPAGPQDAPQAAAQPGQRLTPQVPLPQGFTDPQRAALALRTEAARMSGYRGAEGKVRALNDWAERIEASQAPISMSPGQIRLGADGNVLYRAPERTTNAASVALQRFLAEHPDATSEEIQQFIQRAHPPRSAPAIALQKFIEEHPEATAEDVNKFNADAAAQVAGEKARASAAKGDPTAIKTIADGIEAGQQPPSLTGLYGAGVPVRTELQRRGFNLARANIEWERAKKQVQSLGGPQMTRFVGLATSVDRTIDEVNELAKQMKLSGVVPFNKIELEGFIKLRGNSPEGRLATRYITAVGTLKEEFANLANGGYAPTEPAWTLANKQINENYGVDQLGDSLKEIQRLVRYRFQAIPGMTTVGPAAPNSYTGTPASGPGVGAAEQRQPDAMVGGKPAWKINGKWFDNADGK